MDLPATQMTPAQKPGNLSGENGTQISSQLLEKARADTET